MKFTLYFINFATGEIVIAQRVAKSARHAENNFRRYMRATDTLHSGDNYNLLVYTDWREMDASVPSELWQGQKYTAR